MGFTYTFVSICGDRFSNWIPRNGSIPLHSVSIVNFTEECALLIRNILLILPSKIFVDSKVCDQQQPLSPSQETDDTIRVVLPFNDQISADIVRKQLKDLSLKVHTTIQHVFVSRKIEQELSVKETKPPIVNQQCVVYGFQCDLCDAGYVGYTRGHLHNRVKGHKQQSSAIAKHYKNMHGTMPQGLLKRFDVLKKCRYKFECLVYEMLFIRALKPNLNVQSDSIRAKVFL